MGTNVHFLSKKSLRDIDIPPRKLLNRRAAANSPETADFSDETRFQKFLPCNTGADSDSDDSDPYSSDEFRIYEFKVRRCTRSRSHDWTDCPFAHPGEKARRRDPRRYHYSGAVCADFRRGNCTRGDNCEFAHGVFECWLHPVRYRTEACKDGKNCKRKVCFFAHSAKQLRVLPSNNCNENSSNPQNSSGLRNCNHCCVYCHSVNASPTSTLMGFHHFSPANSPPLSPVKSTGLSPVSRFGERLIRFGGGNLSHKDAVTELMGSLEGMNVSESSLPFSRNRSRNQHQNLSWVDVSFSGDDQQQFVLSPSTPIPSESVNFFSGEESLSENGLTGLDLGWVNDLLQ
ncbi:hypothetical protein LguiA_022504 [Lonicera macranthoides]